MKSHVRLSVLSGLAALALGLASAPMASAITITPAGTSFGTLSAATFSGSGIPNTDVQIFSNGSLTLGLTATQRKANPALSNNGAGIFYATAGGDTLDAAPSLAKWNFDYYVTGLGIGETVDFLYDNGTSVTSFGTFTNSLSLYQDSINLGFFGGFDPTVAGQYGFALVAHNENGEMGRSAIVVNVSTVPDGGSTALMLGGALTLGLYFRRRNAAK